MTQVGSQGGKQSASAGKGDAFFKRAEQVSETSNWDFAIEMYLQGLAREPENIDRGHQGLRKVSLERKLNGGKPAGMMEALKRRGGKDPVEKLINAEFLLAKDPGNVANMVAVMKAAQAAEVAPVTKWICDIILEAEGQAKKPSKNVLLQIMAAYEGIQQYPRAIQTCELALRGSPDDDMLQTKLRDLGATNTRVAGKYGEAGDFAKGVKDMDKQKKLAQGEYIQQTKGAREQRVEDSRADYLAAPKAMGKIHAFVDALCKMEDESYENEAVDVLNKAFSDTQAYQFKMRIGEIRMTQMKRRYRKLIEAGDKAGADEQARQQLAFELQEFGERAKEYPTDLNIKFELGRRQYLGGKLD
jgi:tetratricopeptide (TPR) repeat protein